MHIVDSPAVRLHELAIKQHALLREQKTSAIAYGRFYSGLLEKSVWKNQSELAASLSVSKGHVSKAIKAALLPQEVVEVFGLDGRISFRVVDAIDGLAKTIGIETLCLHAIRLGKRPDVPIPQLLRALAAGERPNDTAVRFKLSPARNGRYIRIESAEIAKLISRLPEVETALNLAIKMAGL